MLHFDYLKDFGGKFSVIKIVTSLVIKYLYLVSYFVSFSSL